MFLVKDGCATDVAGFGKCITYDPQTNVPSFKIYGSNYFLGIYDFGS